MHFAVQLQLAADHTTQTKLLYLSAEMATVDSFLLLLNQASSDIRQFKITVTNVLIAVGAWYTLRLTVKLGSIVFHSGKYLSLYLRKTNLVRVYGEWAVVTGKLY